MDIETTSTPQTALGTMIHTNTLAIARHMIKDMLKMPSSAYSDENKTGQTMRTLARKYKHHIGKRWLSAAYQELMKEDPVQFPPHHPLRYAIMKKAGRSASGIVNVSVVMPPDTFSCKFNCKFCPNETIANGAKVDMPRSYLSNEDAIRRAASVGFDAAEQAWTRFRALESNGHPIDKIEYRILGGTFSCYSCDVADTFMRDLYYAANTYYDVGNRRERMDLDMEQMINITAQVHVVGLGVETRPDMINKDEVIRFRNYGVTRVELGVQHTNDDLLRKLNRGHGIKQSKAAIRLLKEYGFKIEIHIMTDLPGTTPEMDKACYDAVLRDDPDLVPDYMKDYPCLDVIYTEIKQWKMDGRWKPYAEENNGALLKDVLVYRQTITPPWVRVNRIQRDFAAAKENNDFMGFTSSTISSDLGDIVTRLAEARGIYCQCIRCREIGNESYDMSEIKYVKHAFVASGANEYFISAEVERPHRNLLLGFIRLRLCTSLEDSVIPELVGKTAMIRELHVYGHVTPVGDEGQKNGAQHRGIGKTLLRMAEQIASSHKYKKMAVISGIGVRDYYRKNGYTLEGTYMVKKFPSYTWCILGSILCALAIILPVILYYTGYLV
jgi:ELP3 family radical SAM enzyme/protein acetyltransferase